MLSRILLNNTLGSRSLKFIGSQVRFYRTEKYVFGHKIKPEAEDLPNLESVSELSPLFVFFRRHGHLFSDSLDPLNLKNCSEKLDLVKSKLSSSCQQEDGPTQADIFESLKSIYCGPVTIEYDHLSSSEQKEWLMQHFESLTDRFPVSQNEATNIAQLLIKGQMFDQFIASKFASIKRYSGEGAESLIPAVQTILRQAALDGVQTTIFGMPHRGRNNLLTTLFNYPIEIFFRKMKGLSEFAPKTMATGDTFSHFFHSIDLCLPSLDNSSDYISMHATIIPNPSHLEANIPVSMGKARSKMLALRDGDYNESDLETTKNGDKVLCIQIHGDASVTGQGVVAESLAIGACPHFDTGGSIHLIVNNQVGFTTESPRGSSFRYVSDVAKTAGYPVLHVNADHPEVVYRAARLAAQYRQKFRRDVFIDLVCYRRWGHNELDDPTMTQPLMYSHILGKKTCPDAYLEKLQNVNNVSHSLIESNVLQPCKEWNALMHQKLETIEKCVPTKNFTFTGAWSGFDPVSSGITDGIHVINTGVDLQELAELGRKTVHVPEWFSVHPTVQRSVINRRPSMIESAKKEATIDWACGEALAVSSLLSRGHHVRICGQDVGRGTFSHRHFMLVDQNNDSIYVPMNEVSHGWRGRLEVVNSPLSESAVLGFEIGFAADDPRRLVIWEAQFGDFFNAAQVQIDTYFGSSEAKWYQQNGLVINLPHGYDGAGPEHSSCRLERWLQITDSIEAPINTSLKDCESTAKAPQHGIMITDTDACNLHICAPTTPAQYFHLLRRQILRPFRRPLLIVGPKTMLRLPAARNSLQDFAPGSHFHHVIADVKTTNMDRVTEVILCSGKHYYALKEYMESDNIPVEKRQHYAIIRLEQLTPFPIFDLHEELKKYKKAKRFVWSQEEHRNMGAWNFVSRRVKNFLGIELDYAGRMELATPAVGIAQLHKAEIAQVLKQIFFY